MTTDALKDFRGADPVKQGEDPAPSPPVADDDHSATAPIVEEVKVAGVEPQKNDPAPSDGPKLTPFDQKRADIAARFSPKRAAEGSDSDLDFAKDENVYGKLAGDGGDPPADGAEQGDVKAAASPGAAETKPEPMTLAVNGKTIAKSLAEVAALADMTEDEVKADPARAKKYAQRELATADNLERSRIARRDLPARQPDDVDTRSTRPGPDQDRREAGNDDRDQPSASRDTSAEEVAKLIEDIQIGDPKEVAPKLAEFIAKAAGDTARQTMQQGKGDELRQDEINSGISAFKEFLDEHPELAGKPAIAAALGRKVDEEYVADLRKALIAEGESEEEADAILAKANSKQIRDAHLTRRINRDPHVRRIDKGMAEQVYEKVRADFGLPASAPKQQQDLSRQERKEVIPQQPRRASVPPATTQAPPAPISRKAAVAEMAARTGKKPASLR
jgi:hypothetical protein